MLDATAAKRGSFLAKATADLGYGYQIWIIPGQRRQFALLGFKGQRICIDPQSKLIMVHTALEEGPEVWSLWSGLLKQFG